MTIRTVMFLEEYGWVLVDGILTSVDISDDGQEFRDLNGSVFATRSGTYTFDVSFTAQTFYIVTDEWVRDNYPQQHKTRKEITHDEFKRLDGSGRPV